MLCSLPILDPDLRFHLSRLYHSSSTGPLNGLCRRSFQPLRTSDTHVFLSFAAYFLFILTSSLVINLCSAGLSIINQENDLY